MFEELEAGLFTADGAGAWFPRTPVDHRAQYDPLHLMTSLGPLDIVFVPDGARRETRNSSRQPNEQRWSISR